MPNYDGVYELRLFYSTTPSGEEEMSHRLTFDVKPDAAPSPGADIAAIECETKGGSLELLGTWFLDDFLPLLLACYPATANFFLLEMWNIPEGTFDGTFIGSLELTEVGTNGTGSQIAQQTTFTFRSIAGGVARLQLMESSFSGNLKQTPPFATTTANNLTQFLNGNSSIMIARDNSFLNARLRQSDGQNEKLWRKRFRGN